MDKSIGKDKRRLDKRHKKPPPVKTGSKGQTQKEFKNNKTVPSSEPLLVYDDRYSKRNIEPNWNTRQDLSSDSENEQSRAADFEDLLRVPHSVSGHFFLSNEKHWVSEAAEPAIISGKSNQQFGNYFKIDTKHLNASLATIPFYERNGYPPDIFTNQDIKSMKLKAELEEIKYKKLIGNLNTSQKMANRPKSPPAKCLIGADALPSRPSQESAAPVIMQPPQPVPCLIGPLALPPELRNDPNVTGSYAAAGGIADRLSEVTITTVPVTEESVPIRTDATVQDLPNAGRKEDVEKTETKEDMQQWLDDILDM
ncbi:uncharacterized protein LOC131684763 [Topomyia yanbarensis]|uniref:uncharacterized protein LOC131684763 n=1 Tax=Topomyia yanbarensis TaxID=2498891 RepID=UPI00273B76A1|nr:uncharacterized protein LOC131684763 [Topomyia yanbarensis]